MRLTIHPEQGLMVSAHHWYPQGKIEQFIQEKSDWIMGHLASRGQTRKFKFGVGEMITLLGEDLEIEVVASTAIRPRVEIISGDEVNRHSRAGGNPGLEFRKSLEVALKVGSNPTMGPRLRGDDKPGLVVAVPLGNVRNAEKFFEKWLRRFIAQTIEERVMLYAERFKLKMGRITIKSQRSLWGSCSAKQNLNFSRRLIQAPMWLIDYVVCHELAHLTQMNHSEKFWALVKDYYPDYRKARRYLRAFKPTVRLP